MFELNNFDSIEIGLASPDKIRSWSKGEVTKPETINYRTQKPEMGGLFCERIFGPTKDWECHCGKYKRIRYKGMTCDKCGVEITRARVRRERMGTIELAAPVAHIWYSKGTPCRIALMLDIPVKDLEHVLYFHSYIVLDKGDSDFEVKQVIDENAKQKAEAEGKHFVARMGAEAIKELLQAIDLEEESKKIKEALFSSTTTQKNRAAKRLETVEAFRKSYIKNGTRPEWMILDVIPVIPPDLRPMVPLDGGRFAVSDLNDLYRRVISRNDRLKRLMALGSPEIIVRNEKRMLQEAVDALIDNGKHGKAITGPSNREFKSLSSMLRGKQGRFRQNLLGKRVDYSGRSVIVVGPELKLYQCGLPKEMAIELFKPFVMKKLVERNIAQNIKSARKYVDRARPAVWDVLEEVIKDHPVLLNRAPTLHRLSIQAFEPVLIEGRAIKLHPLVCGAFNADFDGDQMAIHVPLSVEAQAEARFLMLASNNILKLSDGKPVMSPTQDMVLGCYYLTISRREDGKKYDERFNECENGVEYKAPIYSSIEEAFMAQQTRNVFLQDEIYVRRTVTTPDGREVTGRIKTTVGRLIFNQAVPQDIEYNGKPRITDEDYLQPEVNVLIGKSGLKKIVGLCFKKHGSQSAADVLDKIKAMGYRYSTLGAITTSVFDMHMPGAKKAILKEAEEKVRVISDYYNEGFITDEERYKKVVEIWKGATADVSKELETTLDKFNPIWMMADSGARGSMDQIKQLAGMRGLMTDPNGKTIEIPVKSCFREGLSVLEYFISSHGGRKGLTDTALKTADSGYLTRRLVDISHEVIVTEEDCFAANGEQPKGIVVKEIVDAVGKTIESLEDRLAGRFTVKDVVNEKTGEVIVKANEMISEDQAKAICKAGITEVEIRSLFTCACKNGVCAKCYGKNMSNNLPVQKGEAVGIIAAQSIGEPGTQLTMRTFHTGGIASTGDITQGLPRVAELFEVRRPKHEAIVYEEKDPGVASIIEKDKQLHVVISQPSGKDKDIAIPFGMSVKIKDGDQVNPGDILTNGSVYPQKILATRGPKAVQEYILNEIQALYRGQGVDINDKHVEIIVRQMLKKVQVEDPGDTELLPGKKYDLNKVEEENQRALEEGKRPATTKRILLGITKAALATDSFLSAASFQQTTTVLAEAAIENKRDYLRGLKENVIIGKLIPAGTGVKDYKDIQPQMSAGNINED